MPAHEFTFIQVTPSDRSRRAQKVLQSKAKSHAAYVGYYKRESRKPSARRSNGHVDVRAGSSGHLDSCSSTEDDSNERPTAETTPEGTLDLVHTSKRDPAVSFLNYEAFRGLRTDPFRYAPTNNEPGDGELIDFFAHNIGTINEAVSFVFNVTNMASSLLEISTQETFYHALLCIIQSMKDQLHSSGLSPSVGVLRRKGRAIARIREGLAESKASGDNTVLCAILLLAVLEGRFQATTVRDMHKKSLAAITSQRGGLENFEDGSLVKASALQFDMFWTWETGKTMFPDQRRVHDPVYPSSPATNVFIQALPIGFRDLFTEGILTYDILPVLTRAAQFSNSTGQKRTDLLLEARRQKKAFNDFWEACPCLGLEDKRYHPLERLLTMSIMFFIYGTFASRSFPTGPTGPTPDLTQKLMTYQSVTKAEEACVQWMWALAIDLLWIARPHPCGDNASMMQLQLRYPELRSVEAISELGAKFLWTKESSEICSVVLEGCYDVKSWFWRYCRR